MKTRLSALQKSTERLRTGLTEPYERLVQFTRQLRRAHETSDLLRRVTRVQHLSTRLQTAMSANDLAKMAQILNEFGLLSNRVGWPILDFYYKVFFCSLKLKRFVEIGEIFSSVKMP